MRFFQQQTHTTRQCHIHNCMLLPHVCCASCALLWSSPWMIRSRWWRVPAVEGFTCPGACQRWRPSGCTARQQCLRSSSSRKNMMKMLQQRKHVTSSTTSPPSPALPSRAKFTAVLVGKSVFPAASLDMMRMLQQLQRKSTHHPTTPSRPTQNFCQRTRANSSLLRRMHACSCGIPPHDAASQTTTN
jgi:hypothetical protein